MSGLGFSHVPKAVKTVKTKYRSIVTKIPVPESLPLLERVYETESHSMHGQLPIIWERAEGVQVFDSWGNKWLDFSSTIFVTNAGHGNKRIVEALNKVINKPLLHTYTFTSSERFEYLNYLISKTPKQFEKAFLLSAGTEATEATLKLMRLNGIKLGKNKGGILCFEGNWHGRTMGAQQMSSNYDQKKWIGYKDPNIYHLDFPYPWDLKGSPDKFFFKILKKIKKINYKKDLCGIMMETFQGWGCFFYPNHFVKIVKKFCKENDLLLCFDEMQAGFGRTGLAFGYEHYKVKPDLICVGKGMGGGVPLSGVIGKKKIMDLPGTGDMSSTHSANPLSCVAGSLVIDEIIRLKILKKVKKKEKVFLSALNKLQKKFKKYIRLVNGKGLIAGIIFYNTEDNIKKLKIIAEKALQKGLLIVHTGRESIKLGPPLTISNSGLIKGLKILEESVAEVCSDKN